MCNRYWNMLSALKSDDIILIIEIPYDTLANQNLYGGNNNAANTHRSRKAIRNWG